MDQGKLWERYGFYLASTDDNPPLTFKEWLSWTMRKYALMQGEYGGNT